MTPTTTEKRNLNQQEQDTSVLSAPTRFDPLLDDVRSSGAVDLIDLGRVKIGVTNGEDQEISPKLDRSFDQAAETHIFVTDNNQTSARKIAVGYELLRNNQVERAVAESQDKELDEAPSSPRSIGSKAGTESSYDKLYYRSLN